MWILDIVKGVLAGLVTPPAATWRRCRQLFTATKLFIDTEHPARGRESETDLARQQVNCLTGVGGRKCWAAGWQPGCSDTRPVYIYTALQRVSIYQVPTQPRAVGDLSIQAGLPGPRRAIASHQSGSKSDPCCIYGSDALML